MTCFQQSDILHNLYHIIFLALYVVNIVIRCVLYDTICYGFNRTAVLHSPLVCKYLSYKMLPEVEHAMGKS